MDVQAVSGDDPRAMLRALRSAVHGAGPALALGGLEQCEFAQGGRPAQEDLTQGEPTQGEPTLEGRPAQEDLARGKQDYPEGVPPGTALVLTTSGSTGIPKSVLLSRSALIASAMATAARIGEGAWLLALPSSYIAGVQVLVRSIVSGREPAVLSGRFSPQAFAAVALSMASSKGGMPIPAYTALVPAQLAQLVQEAEEDARVAAALQRFEAILVGGQALAPALRERAASLGARIVRTYGSTETSGGCVYDGVPLDGVGVRVVAGELHLSGPMLAEGYLDDPALTARTFSRDADGMRWYRTGDTGQVEDGRVQVLGRVDNVIVSGGVNISLDAVERAVRAVPGLEQAVVVPVPDARWGQGSVIVIDQRAAHTVLGTRPGAAIGAQPDTTLGAQPDAATRVQPDTALSAQPDTALRAQQDAAVVAGESSDSLLTAARDRVASAVSLYARPAGLRIVERIPLLPSGKPDRRGLARILEADTSPGGRPR